MVGAAPEDHVHLPARSEPDAEDLAQVSSGWTVCAIVNVEIGARIGELGRQPRTARKFFERYQDRILFRHRRHAPTPARNFRSRICRPEMYRCYFRFLETEDEYFDYAPSAVPPQGRWKIYGIALPDGILRKVYQENAVRILHL